MARKPEEKKKEPQKEPVDPYGFLTVYEEAFEELPIRSAEDERKAWFSFLDMLCLTAIYQKEQREEEILDRVGTLFSDTPLIRSLEPHETPQFPGFLRIRQIYEDLLLSEAVGSAETKPIASLLHRANLSPLEFFAYLLALAYAMKRKYQRLFSILQEERDPASSPTVGLCLDLSVFFLLPDERRPLELLSPDSFLNRYLLKAGEERRDISDMARPLVLRTAALSASLGERGRLGPLRICGEMLPPADEDEPVCFPELLTELRGVLSAAEFYGTGGVAELTGENGSGRRYLMRLLALEEGREVLAVDLRKLIALDGHRQQAITGELILKTVFEDTILYLYHAEEEGKAFPAAYVLSELQTEIPLLFLGSEKPLSERTEEGMRGTVYRIRIPEAGFMAQLSLWRSFALGLNVRFEDSVDLSELVSKYGMNPGRIREALTNTIRISEADRDGFYVKKADLEDQIRRICAVQFKETAKRLQSPFTWEDLKVDERAEKLLRRVIDRVVCRKIVHSDFGFAKKLPYGRGISVVLYGPPGTGKTMAAQVLAKELGLDIYRIDLSQISSKYIGETEKNLGAVFDAARNSNAVLFFDEADSLFSKRTEVSSSHDRYANAETSYLLQKIEEYPGISILATNNMQNFDAAFKRRITYMIPMEEPSEETRLLLWKSAFPPGTPLSEEIDFRLLAQAVTLTGSNIKSISLDAAFRAAAEGRAITYQDLVEAVDAECVKSGRMGIGTELQQAIIRGYREAPTGGYYG